MKTGRKRRPRVGASHYAQHEMAPIPEYCETCGKTPSRTRSPYCSEGCRKLAKQIRLGGGSCRVCRRRAQRSRLYCGYHGRRRCSEPGCRRLAVDAQGACPDHIPTIRRRVARSVRERRRGQDAVPWRRVRERVLSEEPSCRLCGKTSTAVDHIVPLSHGGGEDRGNLEALCATCHSLKTGRDFALNRESEEGEAGNLA